MAMTRLYLAERYLPGMRERAVRAALRRVAAQCARLRDAGETIRYLGSTFVPTDEACLCHFEAERAELVWVASAAAGVPLARVTEAAAMAPEPASGRGPQSRR